MFPWVVYFIHSINNVYVSIPVSQFVPPHPFPPWYPYICSLCLCLYFFFFNINLFYFIYFWLHWVFVAVRGLSPVAASRGHSSLRCMGFSLWWLLLLRSMGSRCAGFSSCWLVGSRAQVQQLWCTGSVALQHVGSSQTRDQTRVPCIGRRILNHCTIREALCLYFCFAIYLYHFSRFHIYALLYDICFSLSDLLHSV